MSSSTLSVNFAFADATTKVFSVGPFDVDSVAVQQFKSRLKMFNEIDATTQKKYTNLYKILKSENGADFTGIKSANIITSEITRIYDAATYGG